MRRQIEPGKNIDRVACARFFARKSVVEGPQGYVYEKYEEETPE